METRHMPALERPNPSRAGLSVVGLWKRHPALRQLVFYLVLALMLGFMVWHNIEFSLREGRLSTIPLYDDVVYQFDALWRIQRLAGEGVASFLSSIVSSPPHAPLSTLTAMLGYALFGIGSESVYLANTWILALYMLMLAYISRPLETVINRILFVAVGLFAPVSHAMITEFRPDMAAGLALAVALAAILCLDPISASRGRRLLVALFALCATIAKPSGVVVVVPILGVAFIVLLALRVLIAKESLLVLLRRMLLPLVAYVVMLAPFAWIWGSTTITYIYQALVGNADIWKTSGSAYYHWTYHLFYVDGGEMALKPLLLPGLVFIGVDLILLALAGRTEDRVAGFGYFVTLVILYSAMALSAEKSTFQGSYFYVPFLAAMAFASVRILVWLNSIFKWAWLTPVLLAAFIVGIGQRYGLASDFTPLPADRAERPQLFDRIMGVISRRIPDRLSDPTCAPKGYTMAVVLNYEPIPADLLSLESLKRGLPSYGNMTYFERSQSGVDQVINNADFVGTLDATYPSSPNNFPGVAFLKPTFERLQHDPLWKGEIVDTIAGVPYWMFVRTACTAKPASGGS